MVMYLKIEVFLLGIFDFMEWIGVSELLWIWVMFRYFFSVIVVVVIVFVFLVFLFGYFIFCNNIKGVYFLLIFQVVVVVVVILFIGSQDIIGGMNGFMNFYIIF